MQLSQARTLAEIRGIEGMVARSYFDLISSVFPEKLEFTGRTFGNTQRPIGAVDPINALFNYGYAVLESHCL